MSCMPYFAPEEIIHAAGALPVGVWGAEIPISEADARLQTFACTMARSSCEMGIRGMLRVCDAVVFPSTCDAFQNLSEIWKALPLMPSTVVNIDMPRQIDRTSALQYALDSVQHFTRRMEHVTGSTISSDALVRSIDIYNEHRRILRTIDNLRKSVPDLIPAENMLSLVLASTFMPKEEHSALARHILESLRAYCPTHQDTREDPSIRIFLTGVMPRPTALLHVLERAGVQVVGDRLGLGSLYYDLEIPKDDDPLRALARGYLSYPPCSTIHRPGASRAQDLIDRIHESRVQGVIIFGMKFCEPEFFDYPDLEASLEKAGIPVLVLETDLGMGDIGPAQTRIEAFLETMRVRTAEV